MPKLTTVVDAGDGKEYPALEFIRLKEATSNADFACDVSFDLETFFTGPGATTLVSVTDNGDGSETVVERSNTAIEDAAGQYLLLNITPK